MIQAVSWGFAPDYTLQNPQLQFPLPNMQGEENAAPLDANALREGNLGAGGKILPKKTVWCLLT